MKLTGLVLTGGGARGAYQAGALRALGEIAQEMHISQPFPVLSGSSSGSINVAYLATHADEMINASRNLSSMWLGLKTRDIYKVGFIPLLLLGLRWLLDLVSGNLYRDKRARALLDTTPLLTLINREFNPQKVEENLALGYIHSVGLNAVNYSTGNKEIFFQTEQAIQPWKRLDRFGIKTHLQAKHIMASAAIPLLFPPVLVNTSYYGDGSLRNYTPLSPAVHMGAEKLLVIAVRKKSEFSPGPAQAHKPSLGRIASMVLNSVLLDALELDYERSSRINNTVKALRPDAETVLRPLEVLMLRPSQDLGVIATSFVDSFPRTVRHLIQGLGSTSDTGDLISYLLFEPPYLKALIDLGYADTMAQKLQVKEFFSL